MYDFEDRIQVLIDANAPIVQIISYETLRIHASLLKISKRAKRSLFVWNISEGLSKYDLLSGSLTSVDDTLRDPSEILEWYSRQENKRVILLLEDFHPNLTEHQPHIISRLRVISRKVSMKELTERILIMSQPVNSLPVELEKEVQILELPLPDRDDIKAIMRAIRGQFELNDNDYSETSRIVEAALGLSTSEAWSAFACAVVNNKKLTEEEIPDIISEKEQVIRKRGNLEYYQPEQDLKDVGGLNRLKDWLCRREKAFTEKAKEFGLETPRGILLLGLPGTGKSLAAKAVANSWKLPLLRLDMGRIFGGIIGQSEDNMRAALRVAEALAPCILWVDEIEKGMAGMQSSGSTDGGTTSRVIGTFLTWMQEKKAPVFVVATANNVAQLPPELLRKGRVDEIFFVDLPDKIDRKDIIRIHLTKRKKQLFSDEDMESLAEISAGFTGAELEEAIKEAMYRAFDNDTDLSFDDIASALGDTMPLSVTMSEVIRDTRAWAKGRAVSASDRTPESAQPPGADKVIRLPQESFNPFMKSD